MVETAITAVALRGRCDRRARLFVVIADAVAGVFGGSR
jgi:hypothetical protein